MLAGIISGINSILGRLTSTRAGYLDKLNISGNVANGADYTATRAGKLDNLDASVTTRAAAADYTSGRAAKLDNLDTAVSTRLSAAVKSVQRGQTIIGNGTTYSDATISSVTMGKSMIHFSYRSDATILSNSLTTGKISSSTSLRFERTGSSGQNYVEWEVIEFY